MPTLDELLDLTPPGVILTLELKDPRFREPEWAARLVERVSERVQDRTVVAVSFHAAYLAAVKAVQPTFPVGHITVWRLRPSPGMELVGPIWPMLLANPRYVRQAHGRGQLVCPLDPTPEPRLRLYRRLDVDAVLTNDPAKTRRALGR